MIAAPALAPDGVARADDANAADVATARELFIQASAAAQKGSWDEARRLYERSLALKRAAITLYSLGVAQKRTGLWVEAIESFRAFLAEPSAAATKTYEGPARDAIVELSPKLAHVTVTLASGAPAGARVEIDGRKIPEAALGTARPMNPGAHVITAIAADRRPARRDVTVKEGEVTAVELVLEIDPTAPSGTAVVPLPSGAPSSPSPSVSHTASATAAPTQTAPLPAEPSRALPVTLLIGGGALLVGGIVMGLTGVAHATGAPTRDGPDARRARTEALVGDVLAGVGLAAAAVGAVVLVVQWRSGAPAAAPPAAVVLSPTGIAVRGRF